MAPRENENKAYAKFGGDKQRTLWYVMVFSGVVNKNLHNPTYNIREGFPFYYEGESFMLFIQTVCF